MKRMVFGEKLMMLREEEEIEVFADKEGENDMQFLVMKMLRTKS